MNRTRQKIVLIAGYFGFGNIGDEAILRSMLADFREKRQALQFVVISGNPMETENQHHVQAIAWTDMAAILNACEESDLIILGGGGLFHDYWGVSEEDLLTQHHSGISYYAGISLLAEMSNKPCILYSIGVGPLLHDAGKKLTRIAFEYADVATVRDLESQQILLELGIAADHIQVTADPAFNLSSDMQKAREIKTQYTELAAPCIAVCLRNWDIEVSSQEWQIEVAAALREFVDGHNASLLLIPFQISPSDPLTDDLAVSRNIARLLNRDEHVIIMEDTLEPETVSGIIESCDLVVGMRLHSLIFAIKAGVPCIGLEYDPKVKNLLRSVGMDEFSIPLPSLRSAHLFEALEKVWSEREKLRPILLQKVDPLKQLARQSGKLAIDLLDQGKLHLDQSANTDFLENLILKQTRRLAKTQKTSQIFNEQLEEQARTLETVQTAMLELTAQLEKRAQEIDDLQIRIDEHLLETQTLNKQIMEGHEIQSALQAQALKHEEMIAVRDEGINWLRGELVIAEDALKKYTSNRFLKIGGRIYALVGRVIRPLRHPILWLEQHRDIYLVLLRITPRPIKQFFKKILGHPISVEAPSPFPSSGENTAPLQSIAPGDFFEALRILPNPSAEELDAILNQEIPARQRHRPDIICFSIIDWSARYQRPQQIMSQFAAHGHRVFYISTSQFQSREDIPRVAVRLIKENVYEICLAVKRHPDIYGEVITDENLEASLLSLNELRTLYKIEQAVSYVMISSWSHLALETQKVWGWQVIYDCMDEWNNFPLIKRSIIDAEMQLVQKCDLLVVTSQRLYETWEKYDRPMVLARNATDYQFYEQRYGPNEILSETTAPLIGYYGAIAEWFDMELMIHVARARPNYTFILLGGVFDMDISVLKALPNVRLLGQQPYETMPQYLYHFDVCLIPFKINPITEATDPVKIYEYFSGGKPVVSVALPEVKPYRELLYFARDREDFLSKLDQAVAEQDPAMQERRKAFARQNTWDKRYDVIMNGITSITPRVSIIIVTYNNLALTKLCLESIIRNTEYPNYEIIVIDNNSTDNTQIFLKDLAERYIHLTVLLNAENLGFAKANNQGLQQAVGEYLILLNNDTIVPPGWISRFMRYMQDPKVGLVGPMTNFAGNEAKLTVQYRSWREMQNFAQEYTWANDGLAADIHMLAMYCVMFRRDVYQVVGGLDEQYRIGMFEDDDYAQRIRAHGYKVICAQDIFVHHFGQAAFQKLIRDNTYNSIFEENRRRYEAKWDTKWIPHKHARLEPDHYPMHAKWMGIPETDRRKNDATLGEYEQKILHENMKWGEHLNVEASGEWHAWLDHPQIATHYHELGLIDTLNWGYWVSKRLGHPAQKSLDLGCGSGMRSLDVWRKHASTFIEGIDVSNERVAEGERQRLEVEAPGRFWVADINKIALPENSYDLIFSAHSFHHFLELEAIMEQVSDALTEDGLFILEEFVGPTQFQWTNIQMKYTRELLSTLPVSLRTFRDGRVKMEEGRPTPAEVMAVSPFESIRSAEILPLFQKYFEVIALRNLGGTIQHLLYNGIIHNFKPGNLEAAQHIQRIIDVEDQLIVRGELPSDFMLLIGQKRK